MAFCPTLNDSSWKHISFKYTTAIWACSRLCRSPKVSNKIWTYLITFRKEYWEGICPSNILGKYPESFSTTLVLAFLPLYLRYVRMIKIQRSSDRKHGHSDSRHPLPHCLRIFADDCSHSGYMGGLHNFPQLLLLFRVIDQYLRRRRLAQRRRLKMTWQNLSLIYCRAFFLIKIHL